MTTLLGTAGIILGFGFLIFVHELGHFLVAKFVGVHCTQFAVGFGQAIVAWRKGLGFSVGTTEPEYNRRIDEALAAGDNPPTESHTREVRYDVEPVPEKTDEAHPGTSQQRREAGEKLGLGETEYRLNWIPLGGYVKMLGQEDLDPNARSNDPRSFNNQSFGGRASIISAGVVMNLIFGVLFFIVAFMSGVEFPAPVVGATVPDSPAATTYAQGFAEDPDYLGLQPGDRIVTADGATARDMTDVLIAVALADPGEPVPVIVERPGEERPLTYLIEPRADEAQDNLRTAGVLPARSTRVTTVLPGSPLAEAGVTEGMRLVQLAGEPVESVGLAPPRAAEGAEQVEAIFEDDGGQRVSVSLPTRPLLPQDADGVRSLLGLQPVAQVSQVMPDSAAADAGVLAGDVVARLGTVAWPTVSRVPELVGAAGDEGVALRVMRDGEQVDLGSIAPRDGLLGIGLRPWLDQPVVAAAVDGSPAASLNLPAGSRIAAAAGVEVTDWASLQRAIAAVQVPAAQTQADTQADEAETAPPATVELPLTIVLPLPDRPQQQATLNVAGDALAAVAGAQYTVPIDEYAAFAPLLVSVSTGNPWEATVIGLDKTRDFIIQTYLTIARLFQGSVGVRALRGPVGIVDAGEDVYQQGWQYLVYFIGMISINLAVLNFLPIPILDGGLMVFLIIEKITGRPVPPKVQIGALYVGLALIGALFATTLFFDVGRLIGG
jgi:regulator of sigma E protease